MNLNYDQSKDTLQALLATANENIPAHTVAVDYDGEVIVDPEIRFPHIDVRRYKFRTQVWNVGVNTARKAQILHEILMSVLNGNNHGLGHSGELSIAA